MQQPIKPIAYISAKKPKDTPAAAFLRAALLAAKRQGHTANVAHAVGVYPA